MWHSRRATAVELLGYLAVYTAAVVAVAVYFPIFLRLGVLLASVGLFLFWIRSRPDFGQRRNLPPGRITAFPLAPIKNHRFYQDQATRHGPVFKMASPLPALTLRPLVCIVGHELGLEVLRRHDKALQVGPVIPLSRYIPRGFLRYMKDDDHAVYSKLFHTAFTNLRLSEWESILASESRIALSRMAKDCIAGSKQGVDPRPYLNKMVFAVLARLLFNIEPGSDAYLRLQACHNAIVHRKFFRPGRARALRQTLAETIAFLQAELSRQMADNGSPDQKPLSIFDELHKIDRTLIDDPTVLGNLLQMLDSGCNDVTGLLVWTLKQLSDNPDQIEQLKESLNSSSPTQEALARNIISETLRLEQSEYLYRRTTQSIQIGDYTVPEGWALRICIRDGHQDANIFEEPEKFCPERFSGTSYAHNEYAPFGLFKHRCMGEKLARDVGRVLITELVRNYSFFVTQDGPREHGNFHWEPNRKYSLCLEPRSSQPQSSNMR
jgi:cytochrome P450